MIDEERSDQTDHLPCDEPFDRSFHRCEGIFRRTRTAALQSEREKEHSSTPNEIELDHGLVVDALMAWLCIAPKLIRLFIIPREIPINHDVAASVQLVDRDGEPLLDFTCDGSEDDQHHVELISEFELNE